jgi:hypothetical protein
VGFCYGLGHREAEAATWFIDTGQPVEEFEDVREFGFGYARTPVSELAAQLAACGVGSQGYLLALRAVLDRFVYQGEYRRARGLP